MEQQEALEKLQAARRRLHDAHAAVRAAEDALTKTKQDIALALGPFKIGDRVQHSGAGAVYEITRADVFSIHDTGVYSEFYGRPVKLDGDLAVKGERYISTMNDKNWHLVSLPQAATGGKE